jgi:hypothetical protein
LYRTSYIPEEIIWGAKFTYDTLEEFETHLMAHYRHTAMTNTSLNEKKNIFC